MSGCPKTSSNDFEERSCAIGVLLHFRRDNGENDNRYSAVSVRKAGKLGRIDSSRSAHAVPVMLEVKSCARGQKDAAITTSLQQHRIGIL